LVLFPLFQADLNQAAAGAEPVAQREATAPPSYGLGSLMQHHFRYSCFRRRSPPNIAHPGEAPSPFADS
jgi:hypothetical protein